jgi:ATP-binding cassette subfamily B protein
LVSVTGPNGAGKSTFCKLLLGLYQPSEGIISADGFALGDYEPTSLLNHTCAVFQDFGMFQLSIRDNLRLGSEANSESNPDGDLLEVLNQVGLAELIARLPQGLDTVVGGRFEEGPDLSMGQWQRLAIARALLRDLAIIVLDEPWAFQDAQANEALNAIVGKLAETMLVVIVTHRELSLLKPAMSLRIIDGQVQRIPDEVLQA